MASAAKRIQKELADLHNNTLTNVSVGPDGDNLFSWKGTIIGPENTPYKSGIFNINITFPTDYPFKPPAVKFLTKIYHPNIADDGAICVHLLKNEAWKPATRLTAVLDALVNMLVTPNPDDALQTDIAQQFKNEYAKFEQTAREWTRKHAN